MKLHFKIFKNINSNAILIVLLSLVYVVTFSSCKKADKKLPDNSSEAQYYKADIDGTHYNQTATGTNGYTAGSSIGGSDDVTISANISPSNSPYPINSTSLAITKGIFHNYFAATNEQFKAYFLPGTFTFTAGFNYNDPSGNGDGFVIDWIDTNGTEWSTSAGAQNNSSIKIISIEDSPNFIYYIRVTLQFSCNLYNSTGEMKQLTNGEFVGFFGKI